MASPTQKENPPEKNIDVDDDEEEEEEEVPLTEEEMNEKLQAACKENNLEDVEYWI